MKDITAITELQGYVLRVLAPATDNHDSVLTEQELNHAINPSLHWNRNTSARSVLSKLQALGLVERDGTHSQKRAWVATEEGKKLVVKLYKDILTINELVAFSDRIRDSYSYKKEGQIAKERYEMEHNEYREFLSDNGKKVAPIAFLTEGESIKGIMKRREEEQE